jgi:hypothetical protein
MINAHFVNPTNFSTGKAGALSKPVALSDSNTWSFWIKREYE